MVTLDLYGLNFEKKYSLFSFWDSGVSYKSQTELRKIRDLSDSLLSSVFVEYLVGLLGLFHHQRFIGNLLPLLQKILL